VEVRRYFDARVLALVLATAAGCDENGAPSGAAADFSATIEITNDVGSLGSLSVDLSFRAADGEIVADAGDPRCDLLAPDAFAVLTRRSSDRISIGVSSFTGIATPTPLARCHVRAGTRPRRRDLAVALREAIAPDGFPPAVAPVVAVTRVKAVTTTTTAPAGVTTSTLFD
jgi:hypothetical protein